MQVLFELSESRGGDPGSFRSVMMLTLEEEEEEEIYLPRTITILNKKNTILMLARSRLPVKAKSHLCWPPTLLTQQKKRQKHTRITSRQN